MTREEAIMWLSDIANDALTIDQEADALSMAIKALKAAEKYDYRYDHTDCIWYHDSRSRCPVTCAQYRDGWNDAMQYIFCDGKGYSPYVREERK